MVVVAVACSAAKKDAGNIDWKDNGSVEWKGSSQVERWAGWLVEMACCWVAGTAISMAEEWGNR